MEVIKSDRKLNNFIDQLSKFDNVETIYNLLNDQLVGLNNINNVILCVSPSANQRVLYFKEKSKVITKQVDHICQSDSGIRHDNIEESQFLANHLQKPMGQMTAFPIKMIQLENLCEKEIPATLFIEHNVEKLEQEYLIKSVVNYIQPFQFSLEKAFIQLYLNDVSVEWQSTFDALKDPICIVDKDFNVLHANKTFSNRFLLKEKCFKKFFARDTPCKDCPNSSVFQSKQSKSVVVSNEGKNYEVHSYPVKIVNNEVISIINYYVDINPKQDLEGKMLQGEKLAVIGQLAHHISQELNNPLKSIKSLADVIIAKDNCDSQMKGDLVEISSAAKRCQKIIDSLMTLTTNKSQAKRKVVSFNDQINLALTLSQSILADKQVHQDLTSENTDIFVIPELLVQVIFNLIQNACQATEQNGVIKLTTKLSNDEVQLIVQDDGHGVKKEIEKDIFKPFYTTKELGKGTGLGLSMSQGIIQSFKGRIEVKSLEGKGTKFIVTLPKSCVEALD